MQSAWTVAIRLISSSNFGLTSANIARQAAGAEKSVKGLNKELAGVSTAGKIAEKALFGFGIAAAATFALGVKGASDLQNATLQSAIAMGRLGSNLDDTMSKMRDFRSIALSMSQMTGQSISDSMTVVARMASAGLSTTQLKTDYRSIAQFTDIMHFGKDKMSYEDAATLGAGLTHDMRLFKSEDSKYGLGRIAQLGYLSPHGTNALTTQIRRMASPLENVLPGTVQQRADQITLLAAWSDRMGTLPFSGSAISQMVTQMIAPRSARVKDGLKDLGVYDQHGKNRFWDSKTQTFDLMGALQQTQRSVAAGRLSGNDEAMKALFSGTQNMQRIMQALTSKESLGAYTALKAQMGAMGADPAKWMDNVQTQLMSTLSGQTGLLTSNFRTLATLLAEQLIPHITDVLTIINNFLGGNPKNKGDRGALGYLADHPGIAKGAGIGVAAMGAYGLARVAMMGGNFIHAFATMGKHGPHGGAGFGHVFGRHAAEGGERAAGRMARAGGGLMEMFRNSIVGRGMGAIGGLARGAAGHMPVSMGAMVDVLAKSTLPRLMGVFVKLGARAIPLVGEILMLIDALKFFGQHSQQIGKVLGTVAGWIIKNGIPMIVNAFAQLVKGIVRFVIDSVKALFTGGSGGIVGVIKSFGSGFGAGFGGQGGTPLHFDTGGRTRGDGMAMLHANEIVVQDRTVRAMDAFFQRQSAGGSGGSAHVALTFEYHAPAGGDEAVHHRAMLVAARKAGETVAEVVSNTLRTSGRAAGGLPAMSGASHFEFATAPG